MQQSGALTRIVCKARKVAIHMNSIKNPLRIVVLLYGSLSIDTRVLRQVKTLNNAGLSVKVLDTELGFGRWFGFEGVDNIPLIKMALHQRTSVISMLRYWVKCIRYLLAHRKSIDVIHAHDLPTLPPAAFFRTLCPHVKLVYDSHELFPEAAGEKISFLLYTVFFGIELVLGGCVDWLIAVSPSFVRLLSHRIKSPVSMIMNLPDLDRAKNTLGKIPLWKGQRNDGLIRIAYSGIVLEHRGYEKIVDAAEYSKKAHGIDCEFWIIGDGPFLPELKSIVQERNLNTHFVFTGRVCFEELLSLTADCDMAIALYENTLNNNASLSNKLFEYMMIGVPFIFTNLTQSLPILQRVNAYVLDNPVSAESITTAIHSLYYDFDRMLQISERGKNLVNSRLNWRMESNRLLQAYKGILCR